MPTHFDLVTIDSPNTNRLAAFWSAVVDLVEVEREDGDRWILLADRQGTRRLGFQRGIHRPGGTHLDLTCGLDEFDAELSRLVDLGSAVLDIRTEPYGRIANLADPDGNVFDLCAYAHDHE